MLCNANKFVFAYLYKKNLIYKIQYIEITKNYQKLQKLLYERTERKYTI